MLKWANITGLEGLFNLNQQGIDIRPTLLRVITDQYLQTSVHTTDEERQFTELAMRLLDETEIATRAAVAKRLAPHAYAPRPIILQLARDVLEVAEPVLLQSPCLTPQDLRSIAAERGASCAQIVARRLKPETSQSIGQPLMLAQVTQPHAATNVTKPPHVDTTSAPLVAMETAPAEPALAPPAGAALLQAEPLCAMAAAVTQQPSVPTESVELLSAQATRNTPDVIVTSSAVDLDDDLGGDLGEPSVPAGCTAVSGCTAASGCTASELSDQFFAADAEERRLILIVLDYSSCGPANPPSALRPADVWQLEAAALRRNLELVASDFERTLGISQQMAHRMIADGQGEPIVIAAKALEIPASVLQRMLLFMNPIVGQSIERLYKLTALYDEMTLEAARRMIDIWQDAEPAQLRKPIHAAQWQSTVSRARQALADISHRTSAKTVPDANRRRVTGTDAR